MTVKVERELTVYNVEDVMEKLKGFTKARKKELLLDLSEIEDIDTAGLQLLVSLQKYGDSKECECKIRISKDMKELFAKYGALHVLELEVVEVRNE
ncbi:MAG: STAS domain-containing protein [Thermotogota bacterium]